jgi:RNA polymerase sigma-70 factor, ECF subfamily
MACELVNPVFLQYQEMLRGFIHKRVKDKSITHDILHQVLLKIYSNCEKLPEVRNIKAWVFQITRNSVYDHFNTLNKRVDMDLELEEEKQDEFPKEGLEYIRPMIDLMPKEYAIPLAMSDLDSIPQKVVAEQLGLTLPATKSRIQRGRQKLKDLFFECFRLELNQQGAPISFEIKENCTSLQRLKKDLQSNCCG